jgi:hypothetical protein
MHLNISAPLRCLSNGWQPSTARRMEPLAAWRCRHERVPAIRGRLLLRVSFLKLGILLQLNMTVVFQQVVCKCNKPRLDPRVSMGTPAFSRTVRFGVGVLTRDYWFCWY